MRMFFAFKYYITKIHNKKERIKKEASENYV